MAKQADLLPVEEARRRILQRFAPLEGESVSLEAAHGRVLRAPVRSAIDLPPFANSSMDGFALLASDSEHAAPDNPVVLPVSDAIAAGRTAHVAIRPGETARIMTGAPLPGGADAVVPFEEVRDRGESIEITAPIRRGASVRPAAQDASKGTTVLEAGAQLGVPQIALLAAIGEGSVTVTRAPRVGILSTGNELISPGRPLQYGQIYNSNTPMLAAAVREAGGVPVEIATASDDPAAITTALQSALPVDLLLTTGGASVGDYDFMKDVVGAGGEVSFWRVKLRPGKPLLFGSFQGVPILGLPGNPTSAMVTFELFVRPALRTMLGAAPLRPTVHARVTEDIPNPGDRESYVRVALASDTDGITAAPAGPQDSAMLLPLAHAHGLLVIPASVDVLHTGQKAPVILLGLPALG